ncbi:MAG: DUF1573 domain-containing protein [Bacteroidia bacterium]
MKASVLLISLFVLAGAKIDFEKKKHDFGEEPFRGKVEHAFEFTNTGDAPLVIETHETSCHCTSAHYDKAPIMPGQKGQILVKYDATKVGAFFRKVTVYTNAGKQTLTIKGEITKGKGKVNPLTGEVE